MSSAEPIDPAAKILGRCREILEDLDFGEVAAWKERNPGGKAIGYLPVYVPRPLLESIGCLPVAIFGGGDQVMPGYHYVSYPSRAGEPAYLCHGAFPGDVQDCQIHRVSVVTVITLQFDTMDPDPCWVLPV